MDGSTLHPATAAGPPTPHPDDVDATKRALRRQIRTERRDRGAAEQEDVAQAVARHVLGDPLVSSATCVALYASTPGEPGTGPLRDALRRLGVRVLLPVSLPDGELDWAEDDGVLAPGRGPGGPEPTGRRLGRDALRDADVVIVPALGVDTLGNRLGQGAGYYDRSLRDLPSEVPLIALVHDDEFLDAAVAPVPTSPHDVPVHAVVTPQRTRWFQPH